MTNAAKRQGRGKRSAVLLASGAALVALFLVSLAIGRYRVSVADVVRILFYKFWTLTGLDRVWPMAVTWTDAMEKTVVGIRLPRIMMACMVGCSLSAAGATFQGVFRNPMASPASNMASIIVSFFI